MARTVVVVAEYLAVVHHVRATLAPFGFRVITSCDLHASYVLARLYRPSVLVMQASGPNVRLTEQALCELRADPATAELGVLLLNGAAMPENAATIHQPPLDSGALLSAVQGLAARATVLARERQNVI
jgi:hypothetical protein